MALRVFNAFISESIIYLQANSHLPGLLSRPRFRKASILVDEMARRLRFTDTFPAK